MITFQNKVKSKFANWLFGETMAKNKKNHEYELAKSLNIINKKIKYLDAENKKLLKRVDLQIETIEKLMIYTTQKDSSINNLIDSYKSVLEYSAKLETALNTKP